MPQTGTTLIKRKTSSISCKKIAPSLFSSINRQKERLIERKSAQSYNTEIYGLKFNIEPGVYRTGIDTELMIDVVKCAKNKTFLEIGCGTGAISIFLAKRCLSGVAVDINANAVKNTTINCNINNVSNLQVKESNVFSNIDDAFDIIVCNPPYNMHEAKDEIERMFWDPQNSMKTSFFKEVKNYLKPNGRVYFGWADFADLNFNFPIYTATQNDLTLVRTFSRPSKGGSNNFIVFEFKILQS